MGFLLSLAVFVGFYARPAFAQELPGFAVNSGASSNNSLNWSGYAATGGSYTSVNGTWTVPAISAASNSGASVVWVGIGGVSGRDLIQAGTQAITDSTGQTSYKAWYELLPAGSRIIPLTINANDSVTVSMSKQTDGQWLIDFKNNTRGQDHQTIVAYNSTLSSAEWIVEVPAIQRSFTALNDFGTVNFTNCAVGQNGVLVSPDQSTARNITMINSNHEALASASSIYRSGAGASFSVTRSDAVSMAVRPTIVSIRRHAVGMGRYGNFQRRAGDAYRRS